MPELEGGVLASWTIGAVPIHNLDEKKLQITEVYINRTEEESCSWQTELSCEWCPSNTVLSPTSAPVGAVPAEKLEARVCREEMLPQECYE